MDFVFTLFWIALVCMAGAALWLLVENKVGGDWL